MKRNARSKDTGLERVILGAFNVGRDWETLDADDRSNPERSAELRSVRDVVSRIAFSSPPARPRAGLKQELLDSLHPPQPVPKTPQVWKSWAAATSSALHVVRSNEGEWETAVHGVKVKRLFADPAKDSVTMLIRMEPGSEYPAHRHGGNEECLVLEGDLRVGDLVLQAGDYQCCATSSIHDVTHTVNGCLLLIVSSTHDQLLA